MLPRSREYSLLNHPQLPRKKDSAESCATSAATIAAFDLPGRGDADCAWRGRQDGPDESCAGADRYRESDSAESRSHADWDGEDDAVALPAYIENAVAIPIATAQRLSCNASIVAMIERADG